jgi:hypothetical protein
MAALFNLPYVIAFLCNHGAQPNSQKNPEKNPLCVRSDGRSAIEKVAGGRKSEPPETELGS